MHIWTWRQAILRVKLEASTKLLLLALSTYMNDHGKSCYPSIDQICKDTSLSERTVFYHLKIAEEAGFLVKEKRDLEGKKWAANLYTAAMPQHLEATATIAPQNEEVQSLHPITRDESGAPHDHENQPYQGFQESSEYASDQEEVQHLHPSTWDEQGSPHGINGSNPSISEESADSAVKNYGVQQLQPKTARGAMVAAKGCNGCSQGVQRLQVNSIYNSPENNKYPPIIPPSNLNDENDEFVKAKAKAKTQPPPYPENFEFFWRTYPKNNASKTESFKSYQKAIKRGTNHETIANGAARYAAYIAAEPSRIQFVKHATTWLNGNCWEVDYPTRSGELLPSSSRKSSKFDVMLEAVSRYHSE